MKAFIAPTFLVAVLVSFALAAPASGPGEESTSALGPRDDAPAAVEEATSLLTTRTGGGSCLKLPTGYCGQDIPYNHCDKYCHDYSGYWFNGNCCCFNTY